MEMHFIDRRDAGQQLAEKLEPYKDSNPVVFGLARGGMLVAAEVARALNAPLDVFIARKLGVPQMPELGFGAIAPGGVRVVDESLVKHVGLTPEEIEIIASREHAVIEKRQSMYGQWSHNDLTGRVAILVDDGLATGVTALASVRSLRLRNPEKIVLAVPACSDTGYELLKKEVDEVICLFTSPFFRAVGLYYDNFSQVTDEQVLETLENTNEATAHAKWSEER